MMNFDPVSRAAMQATKPNNAGRADVLLDVENLRVRFQMTGGGLTAVDGISFQVRRGEFLAVVGESGCGKSVSALSIMRLLPTKTARISAGRLSFAGRDLLSLPEDDMRAIRGREIGMIFQEPMTSLNPVMTIGSQLTEHLKIHLAMPEQVATERALELLNLVGIPDPKTRLGQYPHQFSGGMRQRVMIAIAIACNPRLIIADEPTTALDVTVQAQILDLIQKLTRELGIATIIITHNLGVVARYADNVNVMYAGRIIERAPADRLFARPRHPYTMGLLRAVPRLDEPRRGRLATIEGLPPNLANPPTGCRFASRCPARDDICERDPSLYPAGADHTAACLRLDDLADTGPEQLYGTSVGEATAATLSDQPILQVRDLKTFFPITLRTGWLSSRKVTVRAVDGIDLDIRAGETLGLVGESGCGKTTVGRSVLFLEEPTEGSIAFRGKDLVQADGRERRAEKRSMQVIFQDPFSSLNPRMTIGAILAEPVGVYNLRQGKRAIRERVLELLGQVGLFPEMAERYPHELSGGQRQRVGIARALALEPKLIICDEPVSALDVSVQAQIVNLLEELQATQGLTFLFIAHDLAVVRHISNRIAVMYLGKIVEIADRDQLYSNPLHPYTKALLAAAPIPDPVAERSRSLEALRGELPSPLNHPKGCVFSSRCPIASEECRRHVPSLHDFGAGHRAACIKI